MTTYGEKFSAEEVKEMMSSDMDVDGKVCARAMRVCGWISDSLVACEHGQERAVKICGCPGPKAAYSIKNEQDTNRDSLNMFCQVHYEDFAELLAAD